MKAKHLAAAGLIVGITGLAALGLFVGAVGLLMETWRHAVVGVGFGAACLILAGGLVAVLLHTLDS